MPTDGGGAAETRPMVYKLTSASAKITLRAEMGEKPAMFEVMGTSPGTAMTSGSKNRAKNTSERFHRPAVRVVVSVTC